MLRNRFLKSFAHAGKGLFHVFKSELNFRIQAAVGVVVLVAAFVFPLLIWERILVILLVLLVLLIEILNTVFEYFSDLLKPRLNHYIGVIKDVMAGAVLLTSVVALVVGMMIFYPHLASLFK
jgi:undecaprenol kinase